MKERQPPKCEKCGVIEKYKPEWPNPKCHSVYGVSYGEKGDFKGWICKKCMNKK